MQSKIGGRVDHVSRLIMGELTSSCIKEYNTPTYG